MSSTKTVFSIKDPKTTLDEKIISRVVSLQSVYKQQQNEINDITKQIDNLDNTFEHLEYLYNKLTKSLEVIRWAAKELIVIMNVLAMSATQRTYINSYGGTSIITEYPDRWVWKEVYKKYAPYIPGGLY